MGHRVGGVRVRSGHRLRMGRGWGSGWRRRTRLRRRRRRRSPRAGAALGGRQWGGWQHERGVVRHVGRGRWRQTAAWGRAELLRRIAVIPIPSAVIPIPIAVIPIPNLASAAAGIGRHLPAHPAAVLAAGMLRWRRHVHKERPPAPRPRDPVLGVQPSAGAQEPSENVRVSARQLPLRALEVVQSRPDASLRGLYRHRRRGRGHARSILAGAGAASGAGGGCAAEESVAGAAWGEDRLGARGRRGARRGGGRRRAC